MSAPSDQLEAIVDAALDLAPAERAAYLDQACSADARLRQNVAAMLHAHQHAPTLGSLPSHAPKPTSALPYQLLTWYRSDAKWNKSRPVQQTE